MLRLDVSGLLPKIVDIPEESRFPAVEVRELILYPIHDVGRLRLRADLQDVQDKSAVLFEIRGVVDEIRLERVFIHPQPLVRAGYRDPDLLCDRCCRNTE